MKKLFIIFLIFMMGCIKIPENVTPVDNFKIEKYLGRWYEIARLDHSFERGLSRVTADYSLRDEWGVSRFSIAAIQLKKMNGKRPRKRLILKSNQKPAHEGYKPADSQADDPDGSFTLSCLLLNMVL